MLEGFDSCFFYSSSVSLFSYHFTFIFSSLLFCLLAQKMKGRKERMKPETGFDIFSSLLCYGTPFMFSIRNKSNYFQSISQVEQETYSNSPFVTTCTEYSNEYFMNKNVKRRRFKQIFGSNWKKWNVILTNGAEKWNWTHGMSAWLLSSLCQ